MFVTAAKRLPIYAQAGVDVINRSLAYLFENDIPTSLLKIKKIRQIAIGHNIWTDEERASLIEGVAHHGNNLSSIAESIPTKSISDIVKRYYICIGLVCILVISTLQSLDEPYPLY